MFLPQDVDVGKLVGVMGLPGAVGFSILSAFYGIKIYREFKGNGKNGATGTEVVYRISKDVRNALTVHQLTIDKTMLENNDRLRRDIIEAIREGFKTLRDES